MFRKHRAGLSATAGLSCLELLQITECSSRIKLLGTVEAGLIQLYSINDLPVAQPFIILGPTNTIEALKTNVVIQQIFFCKNRHFLGYKYVNIQNST